MDAPDAGRVWLASPPTVMASALAGELISFAALMDRLERQRKAPGADPMQ